MSEVAKHVSRETYSSEICKKIGFSVLYKICGLQNLRELSVRRRPNMLTGAMGEKRRAKLKSSYAQFGEPLKLIHNR